MPAPQPLTRNEREELEKSLAYYYKTGFHRGTSHDCFRVIDLMTRLGLTTYKEYTIAELEQMYKYIGRVFFERSLTAELSSYEPVSAVRSGVGLGTYITSAPSVRLELKLQSEDQMRMLVATLDGQPNYKAPNYVTNVAVHASIDGVFQVLGDIGSHVTIRHRKNHNEKWSSRHVSAANEKLVDVFDRDGIVGMWKLLDKTWADLLAARPFNKPLSSQMLRIRCNVHIGAMIKIFTSTEQIFGICKGLHALGEILVVVEPTGSTRELPTGDIFEVIPYPVDE